jgi:hypothetical protein
MFDWFCNARTGHLAQFRADWETGLAYNFAIIDALRQHVRALPGSTVTGRRLSASFEDRGATTATVSQLVDLLEPRLSKVWFCTRLIQDSGLVDLPLDLTGPRILLEEDNSWFAPYRDDFDAWLDVKGAFLGAAGAYQPKDPVDRAKKLQLTGEA